MMRLFFVCLFTVLLSNTATAGCACSFIPNAGAYSASGDVLNITHVDGDAETCPSKIRIKSTPPDRKPINVVLACDAGVFKGFEPAPSEFGGSFEWVIAPHEKMDATQIYTGIKLASDITVTLKLPPLLTAMGKKTRSTIMSVDGGKVAPCLCTKIRSERDFAKTMLKAYQDKGLLKLAAKQNMRGKNHKANITMTPKGVLKRFNAPSTTIEAYKDTVTNKAHQEWGKTLGVVIEKSKQTKAQKSAALGVNKSNAKMGAQASTNVFTCKVTMPSAKHIAENCTPSIFTKAVQTHEDTHVALCRKLNAMKVIAWDGKTPVTLGDPLAGFDGQALPLSAYDAYGQSPAQHSADEIAAYTAEIGVYDPWLKQNCQGS